ncbi:MAG: adenylate/guanylate cyclase domain-containing protein [Selenomonadaceae bacterium]|nr:adenylate/guanylate cyclase domain-containing protein [Selenomonadaceae bacterium]
MKKNFTKFIDAFLAGLIITFIAAMGWLDDLDIRAQDNFYQRPGVKNNDIIVIGIDKITISKLGPVSPEYRKYVAEAITYLNNHDPNARPAVIGIDSFYTGSYDSEIDNALVKAAGQYNNVVVAVEVDTDDEYENSENYKNAEDIWSKSWPYIPPYDALAKVVNVGHIHAPTEDVIHHALLFVNAEDHGRIYSLSRTIYEKYCEVRGIDVKSPPETENNGLYYLPFTAKSYSIGYNFLDIIEGRIESDVYRDKIILIGPYAPGLQDALETALDRSDLMYGVDIHANAIDAFMKGFFPREASQHIQLLIIFLLSFILEYSFRNGKMFYITIEWLGVCLGWLLICQLCYWQGLLLHVLWVPIAATVLFIGNVATNYMLARAEKEQVKSTFSRYVDPVIMQQLLNGGSNTLDLGGKLKNIAVLFVDIRGFTSMSEELPPSTVVEILNRYLTLTTECIRRHHGTLDKFVGDCTMAFWNAPIEQKNPVYLACKAAMDMINGSEALRSEIMERYGRDISFGIGIHWGSAVVGNIGTSFRMDYTAIGDTVNTAARLESNAEGGTILISSAVADILGSYADVTSLGNTIKLKGKSSSFEILKLNSLKNWSE